MIVITHVHTILRNHVKRNTEIRSNLCHKSVSEDAR